MSYNTSKLDYKQTRLLIERLIPFDDLVEVRYGSCFCLFHNNTHTPAAKFFHDEDGVTRLQCWSCNRQFTSYDYITRILKQDPMKLINNKYTEKELNDVLKVLKNSGAFNGQLEDFSDEIHNKWVDSDENICTFLDDLYKGYYIK